MKNKKIILVLIIILLPIITTFLYIHININNYKNSILESVKLETNISEITSPDKLSFSEKEIETIFTYSELSNEQKQNMIGKSWIKGCPVSLDDLRILTVSYINFNDETKTGQIIVNKKIASELCDIFKELYENKYQIEKMVPIDEYGGVDELSMKDNNTAGFRYANNDTSSKSYHYTGMAVDINPLQNPYIKGNDIKPSTATKYLDRSVIKQGMIKKNDACYNAFISRGWSWGGNWKTLKDYQHFEKK